MLATLFSGSVHSIATCGVIYRATCIEECAQCRFTCIHECARASQWNRSHSDTCQRTFRHSVTSLHVVNMEDSGDTQTLSPHASECFHTSTHVARQIARHVERFASYRESTITDTNVYGTGFRENLENSPRNIRR